MYKTYKFRITQTEQKLRNDKIEGEKETNITHYEAGKEIRNTIKKLGGTMPKAYNAPTKSLKELEKDNFKK